MITEKYSIVNNLIVHQNKIGGKIKIMKDKKEKYGIGFYGVKDPDKNIIFGLFEFRSEAEALLNDVEKNGINNIDISKYNIQFKI
jgi:hypothetical protein